MTDLRDHSGDIPDLSPPTNAASSASLDPAEWSEFRAVAHKLVDACIDRLQAARDMPWIPVPAAQAAAYRLDGLGRGEAATAQRLVTEIMPYATGNTHPGFFGWVHGTGLASGLLSEMVAATMNSNSGGRDHGMIHVERAVIEWTRDVMGFPETASGVLVTGTSQATVIALAAARTRALGPAVRSDGLGQARLVAYAGRGAHSATAKAMELLGIGNRALRLVPGTDGVMDLAGLRDMIRADRAAGLQPFALIGTAGSVDLAQFDNLTALADLARDEQIWLHVDGAFGAWTRLADAPWRGLSEGIGRADSLACDFHKWMYVPYDCGLVLIRNEAEHRAAFAARPAYLESQAAGLGGGEPWFCDYGIDLSRGGRALKVWAAIETYGTKRLGAAITLNCQLARAMAGLVAADHRMRLMAPITANICVFSADATLSKDQQSVLNRKIAQDLQLAGIAVFSTTMIDGVTVLRAAITNHRTNSADVARAVAAVAELRDRQRSVANGNGGER
ncbi:MAG: pyridoxal-dependent decarboxylase [Paracoccaceae bacterium]